MGMEDYKDEYPYRLGMMIGAAKLAIIDLECDSKESALARLKQALSNETAAEERLKRRREAVA